MAELMVLPCPFCGSEYKGDFAHGDVVSLKFEVNEEKQTLEYYVQCECCGGRTGMWPSLSDAVRVWNCRRGNHGR